MKVSLVGQIGKLARMVRLNRIEKARRLGFGLDKNHTVDSDGSLRSKCINGVKHINIYRERGEEETYDGD